MSVINLIFQVALYIVCVLLILYFIAFFYQLIRVIISRIRHLVSFSILMIFCFLVYLIINSTFFSKPLSPSIELRHTSSNPPDFFLVASGISVEKDMLQNPQKYFWYEIIPGIPMTGEYTCRTNEIILKPTFPFLEHNDYIAHLDFGNLSGKSKLTREFRIATSTPTVMVGQTGPVSPPMNPVKPIFLENKKDFGDYRFVLCPPEVIGIYTSEIGSNEGEIGRGNGEDETRRNVTLKSFYLGNKEVSRRLYHSIMDSSSPPSSIDELFPVANVSWKDAAAFCEKFSDKYKVKARLPTEDEWEFAARAHHNGLASSASAYKDLPFSVWKRGPVRLKGDLSEKDIENSEAFENDAKNSFIFDSSSAEIIGKLEANPWGLYDMHGNVWEWCEQGSLLHVSLGKKPARGGGFASHHWKMCRSSSRCLNDIDIKHVSIGFRVLIEAD